MARNFAAGTDQLNFGSGVPDLTADWTVAGWFQRASFNRGTNLETALWSRWTNTTTNRQLYVYLNSQTAGANVDKIQVDVPYVANIITGGTAVSNTNLHHFAVTRSGNDWVLYLDGASDGTATSATTQETGGDLTFGDTIFVGIGNGDMDGDQAEMAAWDAALTAAEVASLAKRVAPPLVRPTSLVFYSPFWGRINPEVDLVGGNLGTQTFTTFAAHPPMIYPGSRQAIQTRGSHRFRSVWGQRVNTLIGGGVHV